MKNFLIKFCNWKILNTGRKQKSKRVDKKKWIKLKKRTELNEKKQKLHKLYFISRRFVINIALSSQQIFTLL